MRLTVGKVIFDKTMRQNRTIIRIEKDNKVNPYVAQNRFGFVRNLSRDEIREIK